METDSKDIPVAKLFEKEFLSKTKESETKTKIPWREFDEKLLSKKEFLSAYSNWTPA